MSEGKELLRNKLWDNVMSENLAMQIWLIKQYLGFSESLEKLSVGVIVLVIQQLKPRYHLTDRVFMSSLIFSKTADTSVCL